MMKTYPGRQIDLALFCNELKHTGMRDTLLRAIDKLKEHRIRDVESRKLVKSARGQEHLATMVRGVSLRPRHHRDRVAAEVLVERESTASHAPHHRRRQHTHRVVTVVIAWIELEKRSGMRLSEIRLGRLTMMRRAQMKSWTRTVCRESKAVVTVRKEDGDRALKQPLVASLEAPSWTAGTCSHST